VKPVIVLNPNSTRAVTDALSAALEPLRMAGGPAIHCETLAEGPPAIESDADVAAVVEPVCRFLRAREAGAGAFVIACFSDPGLQRGRRATSRPVFGMAESGLLMALARGNRFGVLSILEQSVPRHLAYYRSMRIEKRLAGDLPIGLGVLELDDDARTLARMESVGARLRDELGADVLVMGCAGMARLRDPLERALGMPVIEPVQAAVTMAIGAVQLAARAA
jgi:Asp/Glu/hydantoin racemase